MKNRIVFLICLLPVMVCCGNAFAQDTSAGLTSMDAYNDGRMPDYTGRVSDYEGVFTYGQKEFLDSLIRKHEEETTNEIAIVTIDRPDVDTGNFETFVTTLFNYWGVGKKKTNNGVMICIFPKLRKLRIEVGYGLEERLNDEEAKAIIEEKIIPEFEKGDFFEGTKNGLLAVIENIIPH